MTKDNILYSIISLLLGLIIGFIFANSVNRSGSVGFAPAQVATAAGNNPPPPGHPAIPGGTKPVRKHSLQGWALCG